MTHPKNVSDSELEVLKVLWTLESATVREVLEHLADTERAQGSGREWAYTTAQTLLTRLQEKGCVVAEKQGRAFVFRPTVSRDELVGQSLDALADRVCDGAAMPLLLNLVHSSKFTPAELDHFRAMLDELDAPKKGAKRGAKKRRGA